MLAVERIIMQSPYDMGLQLLVVKLLYVTPFLILHCMPLCRDVKPEFKILKNIINISKVVLYV